MPGDRIELADPEGGQAAELVLFARDGRDLSAALGHRPDRRACGHPRHARCRRRGCGPHSRRRCGAAASTSARPRRSDCSARNSPAGAEAAFTVGEAGYLLVAAPGGPMSPWDQDPPTDLLLFVRRAAPAAAGRRAAARALGRSAPRAARPARHRRALPRARRRVHPDHRRARPAMLGLRRLRPGAARPRRRARDRQRHHAHAHRQRLSQARPVLQVLRRGHEPAGRGGPGHGRPPRQLQPRLHRPLLRGPGLFRPRQLLGQLHRQARRARPAAAEGLAGDQPVLQHRGRRAERHPLRRALVAPRRLCAAAGDDRPGLRLLGLPVRHRRRQWLGPDRHPCPGLSRDQPVQARGGLSHDAGRTLAAHQGDGLPRSRRGAYPRPRRVSRLLAAQQLRQGRPDRGILGLPRALRRDRPLALAQVRGARPRRRDAAAAHAHPQRPQAGGGAGGLLGHVLSRMAA